jgi:DNA-binding NtrC family response regulator
MSSLRHDAVLIADSDAAIRGLLGAIVQRLGRQPVMAADGPAAARLLRAQKFAAAVVDLRLPNTDGNDLLRELDGPEPSLLPRTVVITTAVPPGIDGELKHVAAILRKPFAIEELMAALRRCCDGDGEA